jgi:hypothetical protein
MAMLRFVGRRILPHTIYSDKAHIYQTANIELIQLFAVPADSKTQERLAHHGVTRKFIAPRAAW